MQYYPAENNKADNTSNQSTSNPVSNRSSTQPSLEHFERPYNYSTRPVLNSTSDTEEMPAFTAAHHSAMPPMMAQDPFHTISTAAFDLQEVICQFRTQPELLQLILNSKVEEDRRKAEEAKLRGKEIDYYLQRRQSRDLSMDKPASTIHEALAPVHVARRDMIESSSQQPHAQNGSSTSSNSNDMYAKRENRSHRSSTISSPLSQGASMTGILPQPSSQRRHSAFESLIYSPNGEKRTSLYNGHDDENYPARKRSSHENSPRQSSTSPKSSDFEYMIEDESHVPSGQPGVFQNETKKKRKRREMQAVTTIVETRDPQNDDYLWKNNGNTLHKKTGQKSTYYKCSNSNKGCPVNKTVTLRENNTYLIKYRGVHLTECNRVKRIVDV
ncbi:hypothetical protein INT43_006249 [Umbelopsis isabellina]|uniref:WRKY domain-containing protein n=1 Tax=Mortierella isabellina TaxID=91625 RepID=A0A8H7UHH3_MORIS|nr:hypothetical protein INT43_006249 [Umbelopsis isabellina]